MALQRDGFQEDAFQTGDTLKEESTAFQSDAFQHDAFQIGFIPDTSPVADPFFATLHRIEQGMVTLTAAGMDGVLETA